MADALINKIIKKNFRTLRNRLHRRMYISPNEERRIIDRFHILYYDAHKYGKTWGDTYWMGVKTLKCPFDMWMYHEILYKLRPDVIIECGTANGGSALFFASMFDLLGKGRIISIDVEERPNRPQHDRIQYILGSSTDTSIVEMVRGQIKPDDKVMVVLDSNHRMDHVLAELRTYYSFVSPGYHMVVEDSNLNGHPVNPDFGPGPMEALETFLKENAHFYIDTDCEKFLMSFNPKGFLKKEL
jgi:cephalosporin hydroxylase